MTTSREESAVDKPGSKSGRSQERIRLIAPADGATTAPLQRFGFAPDGESADTTSHSGLVTEPITSMSWVNLGGVPEDRSVPRPVHLEWEFPGASGDEIAYELRVSRDRSFRDALVFKNIAESPGARFFRRDGHARVAVWHLHIGTRYFWKVTAKEGEEQVAESPVWTFTTHGALPRWIRAPGITNVRDMGGWPLPGNRRVRQGVIYRGPAMNMYADGSNPYEVSDTGERILIDRLGIHTDLDLRGCNEEKAAPALDTTRVRWIQIPILAYAMMLECKNEYRRIFEVLADADNYPILFHCAGGYDRSGTVAFLLLGLLGVSKGDLMRDFGLSSLSFAPRSHLADYFQELLSVVMSYGKPEDSINERVENLLRSFGVTEEIIGRIRSQLIVESGAG